MCKVSVIVPVYNVENYINDMLLSVQRQSLTDFEVILVNDGSTDESQAVIDRFCREDSRFRCFIKENGGVASARNMGIDHAKGEYVVFYDPDDYIPQDSLKKMYAAALQNNADMVIGVMEEKSLGESMIYMHSQKLASQKKIDPLDEHFVGAWSLCHKMFSLRMIKENNLRIEKMSNAEDGVFTFNALNKAERICGCNTIAYHYIKRPFWLAPSATQIISNKYLDGLLESHDRILEEAAKLAEKHLPEEKRREYLQPLYVRFIEGEMINGYYRGLWRAEEDLVTRIKARTELYRSHIDDSQWKRLLDRHRDINLAEGFKSLAEMAASPKVSIVIDADIDEHRLDMMMGSVYNQLFPLFEVLVSQEAYEKLDDVYRKKLNLQAVAESEGDFRNCAVKAAKGSMVMIMDDFIMFTKHSLKQMVSRLENDASLDFVTMLMKTWDGENYSQIEALSAAYGYTAGDRKKYDALTRCDAVMSNKLFRKSVLDDMEFCENSADDVVRFYQSLNFEKLRKGVMITDMTDEDILALSGAKLSQTRIKAAYAKNEATRRLIEKLKRHITREDIDKIKRKLGR